MCTLGQWSPAFLAPGTGFMEDNFPRIRGSGAGEMVLGWFKNNYIYCALYFCNYYKLHLRSSDIRSQRLGTPTLGMSPGLVPVYIQNYRIMYLPALLPPEFFLLLKAAFFLGLLPQKWSFSQNLDCPRCHSSSAECLLFIQSWGKG